MDDLDAINIKIDQLKSEIELKLKESARLVSKRETIEEQLIEVQNQLNTNQISLLEANLLIQDLESQLLSIARNTRWIS